MRLRAALLLGLATFAFVSPAYAADDSTTPATTPHKKKKKKHKVAKKDQAEDVEKAKEAASETTKPAEADAAKGDAAKGDEKATESKASESKTAESKSAKPELDSAVASAIAKGDEPTSAIPTPEMIKRTGFGAHRYGYIGGGVLLATGLIFAYYAQGEAKRAETVPSAQETATALNNANAAAGVANVMYVAAGALVVYALLIEVLPQKYADKFSLTVHF